MFRVSPAFTIAAVAGLALGIGANTAIFSVVNTVLLKPLTYPEPDRIVQFLLSSQGVPVLAASIPKFNMWRQETGLFQDVSAYDYGAPGLSLTGGDNPEQVIAVHVTENYFRLFGAPMALGRTFTAEEDRPHGGHVVVLGYGLWKRRYAADPNMVGKTIKLGSDPYTVIGVAGPGFVTDPVADLWLPYQFDLESNDQSHYFSAAGRLKPGVTIAMANARLKVAAEEFHRKYPGPTGPWGGFMVQPLQDFLVSDVRASLLVLVAAVSFVLLIACANVANLLLARATGRKREIAIRAAIGASRGRIIRLLLSESLVLAIAGGAAGLALGTIGVRALLAINPGNIPRIGGDGSAVTLDWRVVAFTVGVSLVTGILFGLFPALDASRTDLGVALKESGGRSGTGLRQNKARSLLVIGETALALILLVGAALLIRSFAALRGVNPGFDSHNVLTMYMSLAGTNIEKTSQVAQLVRDTVQRVEAVPGVEAAASTAAVPLDGGPGLPFDIIGRPLPTGPQRVGWVSISPGFFDVFKIPVLQGRAFNDRDDGAAARVVIVNQAMAREFWPQGNPLNDRIIIGKGYGPQFEEPARQVIGIAGDIHDEGLNRTPRPMMYVPVSQIPDGLTAFGARRLPFAWVVRTRVQPLSLRPAIEKEVRQASGGLAVASVRTMDEVVAQSTARAGFNMSLLTIFGCSALLLAAIGIYGLMAYTVQQRTQEIGIRMALGAERSAVRNMVIFEGMRLALIGVVIGVAAAFALTRFIASFLFGVQAWDPVVFMTVPLLLIAVSLIAVVVPALRATRIDPIVALRYE
jgi:predicted permease